MKNLIIITILIMVGALCLSITEPIQENIDISSSNSHEVQQTLRIFQIEDKIINNINKEFPEREVKYILDAANRNGLSFEHLIILCAIRKAENGPDEKAFGIMNKKANTFDLQAGWCAATIKKNYQRWIGTGRKGDFIDFLGSRYCPTSGDLSSAEKELNHNWIPNVEYWIHRLSN